jgi:mono/diheme cytochrome c family protein
VIFPRLQRLLKRVLGCILVARILVGVMDARLCTSWPLAQGSIALAAVGTNSSSSGTTSQQVSAGREVYLRECTRCHGPIDGDGITAPSLFGAEPAKKLASFQTSQALFTFVRFAMPQDKPGSLPEEDYWAVLAFVLARNGFIDEDVTLGPATAEDVLLRR